MNRPIILSPDAEADVHAIELWYYYKEVGLSFQFAAELQFTLRLIAQYPYAFPLIKKRVRRAFNEWVPLFDLLLFGGRRRICHSCSPSTPPTI